MISLKKITSSALPVIVLLVIVGTMLSCKKKDDASATATMYIKVLYDNEPLSNVHVFTVPFTADVMTDIYGLTKIEGIPSGEYQVYAESGNVTGKSIITLGQGDVQNVTVDINYTGPISFIPEISFVLPDIPCAYAPGDTVVFRVKASNYKEGSQVSWSSDLDGYLASTPINPDGFSDFATSSLKQGHHVISVKAEGRDGYNAFKVDHIDMTGPRKVYLYPPEFSGSSVTLRWSKYQGDDFGFYQVNCRYNDKPGEPFNSTITAGHITIQSDTTITMTLPWSFYTAQFYVLGGNSEGNYNISNIRELNHDIGMFFDGVPVQMMQHPQNNWVYLVFSNRTIIYDYQNRTIIASGDVGSAVRFTDLGDNGSGLELYLPDQYALKVLDGNTLALKRVITFPHKLFSVVSSGLGFLICSQTSDAPDVKPLQVYSLSQNAFIAEGGDAYDAYYMRKVPGRNALVACTRNGYSSELDYFEYSSSGTITTHNNVYDASGGFSPDVMEMSPNGEYFCVGNYGYFRQTDRYLTSVAYMNDSEPVSDFTFNDNGSTAWSCSENSAVINEYHYPSGSIAGGRSVYGSPVHMVYRNHACIVATRTASGTQSCVNVVQVGEK